jgi:hypothetical protein
MNLLQQAQIHVIESLQYITNSTEEGGGWSNLQYSWATTIIDIFQSYTNVLGFLVADGDTFSDIVPNDNLLYIKAAVRDVKGYIRWNNYRDIPVGTTLAYEINEYQLEDFEFHSALWSAEAPTRALTSGDWGPSANFGVTPSLLSL